MAYRLATSNLSVNSILTMLGVSSAKEIFYKGIGLTILKTAGELGATVNGLFLNPTYCPGADATARLANLLADRKMSYFKGYGYDNNVTLSPSYGMNFQYFSNFDELPEEITLPVTTNQYGYAGYIPNKTITVNIGGTYMAGRYISLLIAGVERARVAITGTVNHNVTIPVSVTYPTEFRLSIVS